MSAPSDPTTRDAPREAAARPDSPPARPWRAAAAWALACSVLFMVVYNTTTWLTVGRPDLGTWYFDWELSIPFVPVMIIPYWSIDLLFVASFFVCRERGELDALGRRIVLAILAAGACFLVFPLRLGFPRPPVPGALGLLFDLLRSFDQPVNLCPSLHIALRTLLADTYLRHAPGAARPGVHLWFSLIGLSTLLTWQHHVIDVAGGFVLAALCSYAVREPGPASEVTPEPRLAILYLGGTGLALGLASLTWPWGAVFAWPALSCALVALGYLGLGPWVYGKTGHDLSWASRILMAPCLLGQELSRRWYARRCRPWDQVVPGLWIGRRLDDREAEDAIAQGVTAVLDLAAEFSEAAPFRGLRALSLPILDLTAPTQSQLDAAVAFLAAEVSRGVAYVHCKIGYSRSAAVVGAYLIHAGLAADPEAAVAQLGSVRPSLVVRPEAWESLRIFAARRGLAARS